MTPRQPVLMLILLAATLAFAGVGCKGEDAPTETKPEAASGQPPVPQPGDQPPKPEMPEGKRGPGTLREQLAREVELPEGYPEDAPRYPGAKVNASAWRQGRVAATFSTKDSPETVTAYVSQQLGSNGWQSAPDQVEFESGVVISATKPGEGRAIQVMIATMDQGENDWVTLIAVVTDPTGS